jgi:Raf kinase inhibitor-like YbhB/YbcL family protein
MRLNRPILLTAVLLLSVLAFLDGRTSGEESASTPEGGSAMSLAVTTTAFSPGGAIPSVHTCDGPDSSPDLSWSGAPAGVQSFALIADDPDAPVGTWTHWIIWNIPPHNTGLPKSVPKDETLGDGARQGRNDFRRIGYGGPCPPPGKPHRYFFKLFALDAKLDLKAGAGRNELEQAIKGHVLAQGELVGKFGR